MCIIITGWKTCRPTFIYYRSNITSARTKIRSFYVLWDLSVHPRIVTMSSQDRNEEMKLKWVEILPGKSYVLEAVNFLRSLGMQGNSSRKGHVTRTRGIARVCESCGGEGH